MAIFFRRVFSDSARLPLTRVKLLVLITSIFILCLLLAILATSASHIGQITTHRPNITALTNDPALQTAVQPVEVADLTKDSALSGSFLIQELGTDSSQTGATAQVVINGQDVPVPENGIINEDLTSINGNAYISISVNNSSSSTSTDSHDTPSLKIKSKFRSSIYVHDSGQLNNPSLEVGR